jgi:hypothetical protein
MILVPSAIARINPRMKAIPAIPIAESRNFIIPNAAVSITKAAAAMSTIVIISMVSIAPPSLDI